MKYFTHYNVYLNLAKLLNIILERDKNFPVIYLSKLFLGDGIQSRKIRILRKNIQH